MNVANGAVLDSNGDLDTIDSTGWALAYRHIWNNKWRFKLQLFCNQY